MTATEQAVNTTGFAAGVAEELAAQTVNRFTTIVRQIRDGAYKFQNDGTTAYVTFNSDTHEVKSAQFRILVGQLHEDAFQNVAEEHFVDKVVGHFVTHALAANPTRFSVRVGKVDKDRFIVDRGRGLSSRRYVEISHGKWELVDQSPVPFYFPSGRLGVLPEPAASELGDLDLLRKHLNADDETFPLVKAWVVAAMSPFPPYQALILRGGEDSAKTTAAEFLRRIVDPLAVWGENSFPRTEDDLVTTASAGHLLSFGNMSAISNTQQDMLCRATTSGLFEKRKLYTDKEITTIAVSNPVLANGISDFVTRNDLARRCWFIDMPPMSANKKRPLADIREEFEADLPRILAGLYNALATALSNLKTTTVDNAETAKDVCRWVKASGAVPDIEERANENRSRELKGKAGQTDLVAAVQSFVEANGGGFIGTAAQLFEKLRDKTQYQTAKTFSEHLFRELATFQAMGWEATRKKNGDGHNIFTLRKGGAK